MVIIVADNKVGIAERFITVLLPALLLALNVYFFGPFTIYQGNTSDFDVSLLTLIWINITPAIATILILCTLGLLLPGRLHKWYTSVLFILGVLVWAQGNVFTWDYGVFGKGDIDWTKDTWRGWIDAGTWLLFLILGGIYFGHIYKVVRPGSLLFIIFQAVILAYGSFVKPDIWEEKVSGSVPQDQLFQFSSKQNVIHIILDELQTDVFKGIIDQDSTYYNDVFDGFTLFSENTGLFPSTVMSIPSFLGGQLYPPEVPISDFVDTVYRGMTIPNVLHDKGFEVDIAAEQGWYSYGKVTNWFHIPVPYGVAKDEFDAANSNLMMNLVLFRHSPHFFREAISDGSSKLPLLDRRAVEKNWALRHLSHRTLLSDLIARASIERSKPLYKLIHLTTTHWPAVIKDSCVFAGDILPWTWENIYIQSKCSLDHFVEYLTKLKSLGVYDSALIVIHGDHGYWKIPKSLEQIKLRNIKNNLTRDFRNAEDFAEIVSASSPLLLVKPPGSIGRMKVSNALTSLNDIPATIANILKLDERWTGQSVFEIDTSITPERPFYYYYDLGTWGDKYFERLDEYLITGAARDRNSWQFIATHFPKETIQIKRFIDFGTEEAERYLRYGWSFNERSAGKDSLTFTWAIGDSSSIVVPLPKTSVKVTAKVRSPIAPGRQTVRVFVDGREAGTWVNSGIWEWETLTLVLSGDAKRGKVSTIRFAYSGILTPSKTDSRRLALLFDSLIFEGE